MKEPSVFSQIYSELSFWIKENKEEDLLAKTAKKAVKVVDNLLLDKVPQVFIEVYLTYLKKNHTAI